MKNKILALGLLFLIGCKEGSSGVAFVSAPESTYFQISENCVELPHYSPYYPDGIWARLSQDQTGVSYYIGPNASQNCVNGVNEDITRIDGEWAAYYVEGSPLTEIIFWVDSDAMALDAPQNRWIYYTTIVY